MVRECNTPAFFSDGCPHRRRFVRFSEKLGSTYGITLPIPSVHGSDDEARLSLFKKFCCGFLEKESTHLWHEQTMRLPRFSRMSIGMSLFLYRKVLPTSTPDLQAYLEKMTRPSEGVDEDFLRYVERRVPELFPPGWDLARYPNSALNSVIPTKSCMQRGQTYGGARAEVLTGGVSWRSHQDYVLEVLTTEAPFELCPSRVTSVETGGKQRIVSVGDVNMNLFRPLHSAIYNHLSSFPWLVRGDAKPSKFREFTRVRGELFCSGDYESATDNLNSEVQNKILDLILHNAVSVPKGIKESAWQMLRTKLRFPDGSVREQRRGQLMGNLLSFPLLCIVNYLAFRFYSKTKGKEAPVRINGDDIVFRAPRDVIDRWMEGVRGSGLVLSAGKTMVDATYFSLNSTLFRATDRKVGYVPFVRATCLFPREDGVASLQGRWSSLVVGFHTHRRSAWRVEFLKLNRKYVIQSCRSVTRCLGLNASKSELIEAGLWDRECFYLSLPAESERPLPPSPSVVEQQRVPPGWSLRLVSRVTKEHRKLQKEMGPLFVQCAWSSLTVGTKVERKEHRQLVERTGHPWSCQKTKGDRVRRARLLGISVRNVRRQSLRIIYDFKTRRWEQPSDPFLSSFVRRQRVWLPSEENGPRSLSVSNVQDGDLPEVPQPLDWAARHQCELLVGKNGDYVGFGFRDPGLLC